MLGKVSPGWFGSTIASAGGIDAGCDAEADVGRGQRARVAARYFDQCTQAGTTLPRPQSTQAGRDQRPVVGVQWHEIGDGADGDKVEQHRQVRIAAGKMPGFAQAPAQRQQHVEHHADPGQHLAREGIAGLVGIDDRIRWRERRASQVVVGDQHLPAACLCRSDAGMTGDAMVDRDQEIRLQRGEIIHQPRREAVTMDDAVGNRVRDAPRPEHAQAAHAHRARSGAIAVEIADDDDMAIGGHRGGEQCSRVVETR